MKGFAWLVKAVVIAAIMASAFVFLALRECDKRGLGKHNREPGASESFTNWLTTFEEDLLASGWEEETIADVFRVNSNVWVSVASVAPEEAKAAACRLRAQKQRQGASTAVGAAGIAGSTQITME
jgi:hypothetical protein